MANNASSIWKQIAPWVYEDANAKTPYRSPTTPVTAPVVTPPTTNPALSTTSSASKNVTNQVTQPQTSNQKRLDKLRPSTTTPTNTSTTPITPTNQASDWIGTPKNKLTPPPLWTTQAGQPWWTIVDPKLQYFDDVSKSIWYVDYADYQKQTGQNLDSIAPLYDSNKAMTGDTKFAEQRWAEVATALQNFTYAKNQSEARMLAMGTDIINWPEILKEQEKIGWLINKGIIDPMQIGQILGMDTKKVTDLINGKIEPYVSLSDEAYNDSNADNIQRSIDYQTQKYENDKAQGFEQLRRLEEDYNKQYQEQTTQNKIADWNLSILARMTGTGFSNRGIMWMDEVMRQWQRIISEMSTQYERSSADTRNYLNQLAEAYTYNNAELIDSLNKSIDATKQGYFTAIQAIRTQFGDATVETEKQVKQAMVNFASDIDKYYEDVNAQMKQNFDMAQTNYQNAVQNEQTIYQRQQDSITNYKDASFSMTSAQILADESLTPQQKQVVIAQQQQSAVNYLWKLSASGVARPEDVARMQTLLSNPNVTPEMAVSQIVKDNPSLYWTQAEKQKAPNVEKVIDPLTGKEKSIYWDENTQWRKDVPASPQEVTPNGSLTGKDVSNTILSWNISTLAASMEEWKAYDCGTRGQCGEWYNDAVGIKNGTRVGNTYSEKTKFIDKTVWFEEWQEWMWVVFNPWGDYEKRGHIWVLSSWLIERNGVQWYEVISANRVAPEKLGKHFVSTADISLSGGWFIPTNAVEESKPTTSTQYTPEVQKMAESIIKWIGDYPSKNSKIYNDVVSAVWSMVESKKANTDDYQLKSLYDSSVYEKTVSDTGIKQIQDIKTVVWWIENLKKQLSKEDTWPIVGFLRGKNPYDVDAWAITAQINQLAPKVARWVFWEVGVLTDADVDRYLKTIPNLKQTKDLGNIVWDLLQIAVYKSFINTVVTNAQGWRNMSNFITDYEKAKSRLENKGVSYIPFDNEVPQQAQPTNDDDFLLSLVQ